MRLGWRSSIPSVPIHPNPFLASKRWPDDPLLDLTSAVIDHFRNRQLITFTHGSGDLISTVIVQSVANKASRVQCRISTNGSEVVKQHTSLYSLNFMCHLILAYLHYRFLCHSLILHGYKFSGSRPPSFLLCIHLHTARYILPRHLFDKSS